MVVIQMIVCSESIFNKPFFFFCILVGFFHSVGSKDNTVNRLNIRVLSLVGSYPVGVGVPSDGELSPGSVKDGTFLDHTTVKCSNTTVKWVGSPSSTYHTLLLMLSLLRLLFPSSHH